MYAVPDFAAAESAADAQRYGAMCDRGEYLNALKANLTHDLITDVMAGRWSANPCAYSRYTLRDLFNDELAGSAAFDALLDALPAILRSADVKYAVAPVIRQVAGRIADSVIDRADLDGRI